MNRAQHYVEAERLLEEGRKVVRSIGNWADMREQLTVDRAPGGHDYDAFTHRMDELGKKAMGIWAQAQVHATLASVQAHGVASQAARIAAGHTPHGD